MRKFNKGFVLVFVCFSFVMCNKKNSKTQERNLY